MVKNRIDYVRNITKKIIISDGSFLILVMDVPMQIQRHRQKMK